MPVGAETRFTNTVSIDLPRPSLPGVRPQDTRAPEPFQQVARETQAGTEGCFNVDIEIGMDIDIDIDRDRDRDTDLV